MRHVMVRERVFLFHGHGGGRVKNGKGIVVHVGNVELRGVWTKRQGDRAVQWQVVLDGVDGGHVGGGVWAISVGESDGGGVVGVRVGHLLHTDRG